MDKPGKKNANGNSAVHKKAKSSGISVVTGEDFARLMSSLMSDVISGTISPEVTHAACNAGGKLLKVVEMQYRYGATAVKPNQRPFLLAPANAAPRASAG